MDAFEKVSLEDEIFEIKALGGRDILKQQSALACLGDHCAEYLGLWSSISHGSLGLTSPALSRSTVTVYEA